MVRSGAIVVFRTFMTGELFALLKSSSLLAGADHVHDWEDDGFAAGIERARMEPGLLNGLFAARAGQLRQGRSVKWAASYLSGLLIGSELAERAAGRSLPEHVTIIGETGLLPLYERALSIFGATYECMNGELCSLAGLGLLSADD
jgi:2-dehydro-3-deoxygalactonokinase